jgi:hypothetical protein
VKLAGLEVNECFLKYTFLGGYAKISNIQNLKRLAWLQTRSILAVNLMMEVDV